MQTKVDSFHQALLTASPFVLVNVGAPWCGLCRLIDPVMDHLSIEWSGSLSVIRIDAEKNFHWAHRQQIRVLPTLILYKEGEELARLTGLSSRQEVIHQCEQLLLQHLLGSAC
ncbi:MAG: thioredoxin family protein [Synechococcaceae cyanobacterium RM1_1_27]|nr:thioredoxin family protein [Synechococcaceae cyanobacterium SM2_3_2]NJO85415.1 thioredoxin family protein [Synechococcaceae cyanobacterium RM1_1_27]